MRGDCYELITPHSFLPSLPPPLSLDDRLFVKRTQWIPTGGLRIISDNHLYQPFDLDKTYLNSDQFEVCGEVIEISHIIH